MDYPINGFISYSHNDKDLLKEFKNHLVALERIGFICTWTDHMIEPGNKWEDAILNKLKTAHIILLLVSSDFIASEYINTIEVKEALQRAEVGEARLIPIILRDVLWEKMPFSKFQALPELGKPVDDLNYWGNHDKALVNVVQGIEKVLQTLTIQETKYETSLKELIPEDTLHTALLSLDYKEQTKVFRKLLETKPHVGAFLIHGGLDQGQVWLLHRLISNTSIKNVDKPLFRFPFRRRACGVTLEKLWYSLGKWVSGSNSPRTPQLIAERIYALWKKQSVILILDDLDQVSEQYLQQFLQEFWMPLMAFVGKYPNDMSNYYLLLFLIDNGGRTERWNIPWEDQLASPQLPVRLQKLRSFSRKDIEDWIENEVNRLPSKLTTETILQNGNLPLTVLQQICELCGHDWYDREREWTEKYGNIR